jgi:8-oxo-dGTP pyrophosphatase MutT (NUDIX family)
MMHESLDAELLADRTHLMHPPPMQGNKRTIHRTIVTAFIESTDGLILLGKARPGGVHPGYWKRPGGGVDEGETLEAALSREVLEETGIDITAAHIRLVRDTRVVEAEKTLTETGEVVWVVMHLHEYHITLPLQADRVALLANDDLTDLTWFQASQLKHIPLSPPVEVALREDAYDFAREK